LALEWITLRLHGFFKQAPLPVIIFLIPKLSDFQVCCRYKKNVVPL